MAAEGASRAREIPEELVNHALLVEDDANIRRMLATVLRRRGLRVDEFDNGEAAWQCYQAARHPLVILDWMLPGISGIDLCRRIRKLPGSEYCHILVETARTGQQDLMAVLEAGADDYLPKPLSMQLLRVRLTIAEQAVREKARRRLAETELEKSEESFRLLVQALPDMVYKLDPEGNFTFVSEAADQFGYRPGDLLGKHFTTLIADDDASRVSRHLVLPRFRGRSTGDESAPKLFDEKRGRRRMTAHLDVRIKPPPGMRAEGGETPAGKVGEVNACGIYDDSEFPAQGFVGTSGIIRDITKRRQMQEALILSERMAAVGTLAGGVAHEFNNLHAIIKGYLEMAIDDARITGQARKWLAVALESTRHAAEVTHNLLTLCGRGKGCKRRLRLADVIASTLKIVQAEFETEGITFEVETGDAPPVLADRTQLGQVLMNFIINARHAVSGRALKRISVSCGRERERIYLRVADTGCGMSEVVRARIFDPFFTTKGERAEGDHVRHDLKGAGLGLSICDTIAREHRGEITVESHLGKGSVFTLWLPPAPVGESGRDADSAAERGEPDFSAHAGARVLILDDEARIRDFLSITLRAKGLEVTATDDGEAALREHARQPFDLLLVDLQMPKLPGEDFLKRLKSECGGRGGSAVVMTGKLTGAVEEEGSLAFHSLVPKPFNMRGLLTALHAALQGRLD